MANEYTPSSQWKTGAAASKKDIGTGGRRLSEALCDPWLKQGSARTPVQKLFSYV